MGTESNTDVVRRFLLTLCNGHLDDAAKMLTDDFTIWVLGVGDVDRETLAVRWDGSFGLAPGPDAVKIIGITAEDDRVVAELAIDFKLADGRDFKLSAHTLYVIRDGRIAKVREYLDTAYIQKRLGPELGGR